MQKHDTLLIASAVAENRRHLRIIMEGRYNLLEAVSVTQALLLLEQNKDCIASVLLGTSLIDDYGKLVLESAKSKELAKDISIIVITEDKEHEKPGPYFFRGASDVVPIDYDSYAMPFRLDNIIKLHMHSYHFEELYAEKEKQQREANATLVDALSTIIEFRNTEAGLHVKKIRGYTYALLKKVMEFCPEYRLDENTIRLISGASALHDIGKITIPDSILTKPGRLTNEEWAVMKTHPVAGCDILRTLSGVVEDDYLTYAYNICRYHHERWDGSGYPDRLKGEEIPICAQVVGVADAYEALTSDRVYKESFTPDMAANMIIAGECGEFSPTLIECFKQVTEEFERIHKESRRNILAEEENLILPVNVDISENSAAWVDAKFNTIVHYLGALLVEVNLDRNTIHVMYNPYPSILPTDGLNTFEKIREYIVENIIIEEEKERWLKLFTEEVFDYVEKDMRRVTHFFHFKDRNGNVAGKFELTILRAGAIKRRSFAVAARVISEEKPMVKHNFTAYPLLDSAYICRNDGFFTLANRDRRLKTLAGYSIDEIWEKFDGRLYDVIYPADREMVAEEFRRQLQKGTSVLLEHRIVTKDGRVVWVANKSYLEINEDGKEYLHCFLTDINNTRTAYENIKQKHSLYRTILSNSGNVLFEWDIEADRISYSDTYSSLFAFAPPTENVSARLANRPLFHPDDVPTVLDKISDLYKGSRFEIAELRITGNGGRYNWCRIRAFGRFDDKGGLVGIYGSIVDINEEKRGTHNLIRRSERDPLTGLLNKTAVKEKAEEYLSYYPQGANCALVIIDIDNFKLINDGYGHLFGDSILIKVAKEISAAFMGQDIVSRIGGDEFMVLVRGLSDRNVLEDICRNLLESLGRILDERMWQTVVSRSIGVSLSPRHGNDYFSLFEAADRALYMSKAKGKNQFCFYDPDNKDMQNYSGSIRTEIDGGSFEGEGVASVNISRALSMLYNTKNSHQAISDVLAFLGEKMNVSRVYIFENSADNKFCSNTFEWCNVGISPEIGNLQNVSYESDINGYENNFNRQGVFYCPDIDVLPPEVYRIVERQGIKSMLQCAIKKDGKFVGYIGFDQCDSQRLWVKDDVSMLTYFSNILSMYLLEYRKNQRISDRSEDLNTILDNTNGWVYVINPDTYEIEYMNRKAAAEAKDCPGCTTCYEKIMNRNRPCPVCPVKDIRQQKANRVISKDEYTGVEILAEATMIKWRGMDRCMVTSRKLPKRS